MKNKRIDEEKWVFKFTKPTIMKFQPAEDYDDPSQRQQNGFICRVKTFFSPPSRTKTPSPIKRQTSVNAEHFAIPQAKRSSSKHSILRYVKRLTNDHVLVGNEDQLDAMCISGIVQ